MNDNRKTYYIGDIARELGLSQRAVRYYEELGFIKPTRTDGGFRTFEAHDADILRAVLQFKELGMSLDDIRSIFLPGKEKLNPEGMFHLRNTLLERRREIEARICSCEEGLRHIDRALKIVSRCSTCGEPCDTGKCAECLKRQQGDKPPIITPLLSRGQEEER
ncbi:MAG TPA: MerR family transcriptional regulator [bacterium]|nr:MerR family transcriptional regulator [bacterium]